MLPIHTAPVSDASEAASRGQVLARRNQTSPWVSFLESGRVTLGVMAGDVKDISSVCWRGRAVCRPLPLCWTCSLPWTPRPVAPVGCCSTPRHLRERSLISGSGRSLNLLELTGLRSLAGV